MQFPREDAAYLKYLRFTAFVIRALQTAKQQGAADELYGCLVALKEASRAWEDADAVAYASGADESAALLESQRLVSHLARQLGARDATARRRPPYTQLFPKGVRPPTKAQHVESRRALVARMIHLLPEDDPLRAYAPTLLALADTVERSRQEIAKCDQEAELAYLRFAERRTALLVALKKTYHRLALTLNADAAEAFFPVSKPAKKSNPEL